MIEGDGNRGDSLFIDDAPEGLGNPRFVKDHKGVWDLKKSDRYVQEVEPKREGMIRTFETGATRDSDEGKYDYEGFLSPIVIQEFGKYMHSHRIQTDGGLRASDNWQKGIPLAQYMKSLWRHMHQLWLLHRGYKALDEKGNNVTREQAACGILFNTMGYLHELLGGSSNAVHQGR